MGQNQSSLEDVNTENKMRDRDTNTKISVLDCCSKKKSFDDSYDVIKNIDWKRNIIEYLKANLENEFSLILIKCIEDHDSTDDTKFQNELTQASILVKDTLGYTVSSRPNLYQDIELSNKKKGKSEKNLYQNDQDQELAQRILRSESMCLFDVKYFYLNEENDCFEKSFEYFTFNTTSVSASVDSENDQIISPKASNKTDNLIVPLSNNVLSASEPSLTSLFDGSKKNVYFNRKEKKSADAKKNKKEFRQNKKSRNKNKRSEYPDEENSFNFFKKITDLIAKHLKQDQNIFRKLIKTFEEHLEQKYEENPNNLNQIKEYVLKCTEDVHLFVGVMVIGIKAFYGLNKPNKKQGQNILLTSDSLINFVTSNIFSNKIHAIIFNLYQLLNFLAEDNYFKALESFQDLNPQNFGVRDDFCLNERTIKLLKRQNLPLNIENSELPSNFKLLPRPYNMALSKLNSLTHKTTPFQKLKTIMEVVEAISLSIDNFYKSLGVQKSKKVDSEQTLAIFMYVLAQSKIRDILVHCRIIKNFVTENVLSSIPGYYAQMFEEAFKKICTKNENDDSRQSKHTFSVSSYKFNESYEFSSVKQIE